MEVGFEQIFLMYNGAVSEVAEVFDTYVYRTGIEQEISATVRRLDYSNQWLDWRSS